MGHDLAIVLYHEINLQAVHYSRLASSCAGCLAQLGLAWLSSAELVKTLHPQAGLGLQWS